MRRFFCLVLVGTVALGAWSYRSANRGGRPLQVGDDVIRRPLADETNARTNSSGSGTVKEGLAFYRYLIYLPPHYSTRSEKWPLIVFLHGACAEESLEKLKHFGPIKYALDHQDCGFVAIAPATARGWSLVGLHSFLIEVQKEYPGIDGRRVCLTGYSMGANACWMMACHYPQRFAAVAVVAGAGNPGEASRKLGRLPVWVFHGARDRVIPVEYGWQMIHALQRAGGPVRSTIYSNCGHEAWYPAFRDPELYEWLLAATVDGSRAK